MEHVKSFQPLLVTHLAFKKYIETNLKEYGLNPGNPKVMLYISDHEGCRQKDLAESFYVETCTLSSVLSNMEKSGLIIRKRLRNDKRSYAIYTTPKCRRLLKPVKEQFEKGVEIALSGLSAEESEHLYGYLERIAQNLREANENNTAKET
ncbi:MAG: MarR family transcriptional regulator [Lachnospiraceae bacterium]|nr:MarR family transcriptional regulator [Lachnospiraceae bacterium]